MATTYRRKRETHLDGPFSARLIEMLESPAYRTLGGSARKILDRLEIEHAHHGGCDNGELPCTFDDFMDYGVRRNSINVAIRELVTLGFIEVTEEGRAGNADWRRPNKFRLTYRSVGNARPTHEWKATATAHDAKMKLRRAKGLPPKIRTPVYISHTFRYAKRYYESTPQGQKTPINEGSTYPIHSNDSYSSAYPSFYPFLS
jgi:hypothetical protein